MKKILLLTLMSLCLFTTSYSQGKDTTTVCSTFKRTTEDLTARFKSYFYDESGHMNCSKLPNFSAKECAVVAQDGSDILEMLTDITGVDVPITDTYKYKFVSSDGQTTISITGKLNPGKTFEYATMEVNIPSCPEIQTIHIVTGEYFDKIEEDIPIRLIK
ncbi:MULTISPECIES: hypothetical protein [Prevotella]|nr:MULTISPECIES: hypothetical protein [Prevotella]MDN5553041.1 hypothetical protein [Prevotella sp.]